MSPSFSALGVPADVVSRLNARGITTPFPIQAATLRDGLAGRDVSGRAPTGSGKTLAFGIPLIVDCRRAKPKRPRRLVLVPTRELATQVCDELRKLAGRDGVRIESIYGGVSQQRQVTALRRGVDIVVACPGRLMDLIDQNAIRLDGIDMVVLDEADRMADMGFLPDVRKLLDMCPNDRRTILFSATLDGDVDVLVKHYQNDPVRHEVEAPEEQQGDVDHHFWMVSRNDRIPTAAAVVDRMGPTVVFCRTKRGADRVAEQLDRAGVAAIAIHGDRSQAQRDRALEQFKRGRVAALVATDVAARGIHVDDVAAVIHFDPPEDSKDYVHRSGRTGRAGRHGVVVSLVPQEKKKLVARMQRELELPRGTHDVDLESLGEPTTFVPVRESFDDRSDTRRDGRGKAAGANGRKPRFSGSGQSHRNGGRNRTTRGTQSGERTGRSERSSGYGRTDRTDRTDRNERTDRSGGSSRSGRPERSGRTGGNARSERSERAGQGERANGFGRTRSAVGRSSGAKRRRG